MDYLILYFVLFCSSIYFIWLSFESRRIRGLKKVSKKLGFSFTSRPLRDSINHPVSRLFEHGGEDRFFHAMEGTYNGAKCVISEYHYYDRIGGETSKMKITVFIFENLKKKIPFFEICPKPNNSSFFLLKSVPKELDIESGKTELDDHFLVQGKETRKIRKILNSFDRGTLLKHPRMSIESQGGLLMFYNEWHRTKPSKLENELEFYYNLFRVVNDS